uniref:ABC transporter permease n=1 Tax=Aerococcus urinaeequi TaxID=51665 RepID=UPI00352BB2C7
MWKTIFRRVLLMLPQILILSILVFAVARLMPGDPFTGLITPETDPSTIEALRERAGLNEPIIVQYFNWLKNAFQGDFGMSYTYKVPVSTLIGGRAVNTIFLSLLTLIFTYLIALPLGILSGRYNNSSFDKGVVLYNFISYAIPTFVLALLMVWLFGYELQWFPTNGSVSTGLSAGTPAYYWDRFYQISIPGQ